MPVSPRSVVGSNTWRRWLFLAVLGMYVLTAAGQFQTVDAAQELGVAVSLRHGDGFRSAFPVSPGGGTTIGRDGAPYAGHDIGSSLLYLPVALVPGTAERVERPSGSTTTDTTSVRPNRRAYFIASFLPPLLGALIVLVFASILTDLGFEPVTVVVTALALAFTTIVWVYAHVSFDSTATALAVTIAVWAANRFLRAATIGAAAATGAAIGAAILIRVDSVIMAPFLAAPVVWATLRPTSRRRGRSRATVRTSVALLGPILVGLAVDLAYNWYRFGSVTDNGHTDDGFLRFTPRIGEGVVGQVVSPGKGLLIFSPLLIVALFRWRWFLRRHSVMAVSILGAAGASVLAHAAIVGWAGDQAWGARFTVPLVPMLAIPLARVVAEVRRGRIARSARFGVWALGAAGLVIQLTGVLVDFFAVVTSRRARGLDTATSITHAAYLDGLGVLWRATTSAQPYPGLTPAWVDALHVARFDVWWVRAATVSGWNVVTIGVPLVLAAATVTAFVMLRRVLARHTGDVGTARVTRPA